MTDADAPDGRAAGPSSRGTRTARRIEQSAVGLVLEHGYDSTTVDMICEAAGISQRTFFNHFPTKDAAVIGTDLPALDEQRVRQFLVGEGGDVLAEAMALVSLAAVPTGSDPALMAQRMRAVSSSPELLHRQMERFGRIEAELSEVLALRLGRQSGQEETADEIREQARLAAHMLAGAMRYSAGLLMSGDVDDPTAALDVARARLSRVLPKLA